MTTGTLCPVLSGLLAAQPRQQCRAGEAPLLADAPPRQLALLRRHHQLVLGDLQQRGCLSGAQHLGLILAQRDPADRQATVAEVGADGILDQAALALPRSRSRPQRFAPERPSQFQGPS